MKLSPLAGKPPESGMLVNVPKLITAYYADVPDPLFPAIFADANGSAAGESVLAEDFVATFLTVVTRSVEGENVRIG